MQDLAGKKKEEFCWFCQLFVADKIISSSFVSAPVEKPKLGGTHIFVFFLARAQNFCIKMQIFC